MELFGSVIPLVGKALDIRSARHELLAANIANADTPGYKAVDLVFEDELRRALISGGATRLSRTDPRHLSNASPLGLDTGEIELEGTPSRLDRNSVHLEQEMVKLAENSFMYEANLQMLSGKFKGLKEAISEGR